MADKRAVLLTVVGRNFDGIDVEGMAAGNGLDLVVLAHFNGDLGAVIAHSDTVGDAFYVGTGNVDFDAKVAASVGAPMVITYDRPGAHVDMAVAQAEKLGAVVSEACDYNRIAWAIGPALEKPATPVMSPAYFENWLLKRASDAGAHIVLPEGEDDRILEAAHQLLARDIAKLTILGNPAQVADRAQQLGLDLSRATIIDHLNSDYVDEFAETFAQLRKKKGITLEQAKETMTDVSYFATMMVYLGYADGMVSGAAHTTAHTIKPALQIIKTTPDASVVSSIFLMVRPHTLWAFGDCAVNPNPTAEQTGEIAVVSAKTAAQFGIDPRVAVLSYSTGDSGAGEDVEQAIEAVAAAKKIDPSIPVEGPLQFDAAVDPGVAERKMPGSEVAGHANVFIFPDLSAGNIGYKAVQRTGDALAVGPILQGLKKPVNDLSRGATIPDIVNTVAITAIQAGGNN